MGKSKKLQLNDGWAIYLRTSSDDNQAPERSQESQRRVIHEKLVADSGLPIIDEYADTYSGRSTDRANYQRLLADARQGRFSHVAVFAIDRFGRNDVECGRAVDELTALGIKIKIAGYLDLDPSNASGRMIFGLMSSVARFESDRNGERTIEGMKTKLLEGGWAFKAPDGYLNTEERTDAGDRQNARYRRWVEKDPQQIKVWREAWDLLLTEQHSLTEICEELHRHGYQLRSGAPFVYVKENGHRTPNTGALSRVFHNWFYAGWVDVHNDWVSIPPKTVRGQWEPVVSTEEFEKGLAILERRSRTNPHKSRNFYLLTSLVFLQRNDGSLTRLMGSTTNASRKNGGTAYYCAQGNMPANILCRKVDENVHQHLHAIQIDEQLVPELQATFQAHLDTFMEDSSDDHKQLEEALKRIDDEEERTARLYATGRITEKVWNKLWSEWNDKRAAIRESLNGMQEAREQHLENLDAGLMLLTKVGILYDRLDKHAQKRVLKYLVKQIVIDLEGAILKMELHAPFTYLRELVDGAEWGATSEGNKKPRHTGLECSSSQRLGVTTGRKDEQHFLAENIIRFTKRTTYPQRARLERLLVTG